MALLSPRVWLALALAAVLTFTHLASYKSGKANVRADWAIEKQAQTEAVAAASESARIKEKALTFTNDGITNAYIKEKARLVADSRVTADRLRDLKASIDSAAGTDAAPELGDYGDPRSNIIAGCANTVVILDEAVKRLAGQTTALQSYTREVCLSR